MSHHQHQTQEPQQNVIKVFCLTGHAFNENNEFAGVKRVGKDTLASLIKKNIDSEYVNLHILSLAGAFKHSLGKYYKYNPDDFESNVLSKVEPVECFAGLSARYVWERFGTEVVRQIRDSLPELKVNCRQTWVDHVRKQIQWCAESPLTKLTAETFDLAFHELQMPREQIIERFGVSRKQLEDTLYQRMKEQKLPDASSKKTTELFVITDVRSVDELFALSEFSLFYFSVIRDSEPRLYLGMMKAWLVVTLDETGNKFTATVTKAERINPAGQIIPLPPGGTTTIEGVRITAEPQP